MKILGWIAAANMSIPFGILWLLHATHIFAHRSQASSASPLVIFAPERQNDKHFRDEGNLHEGREKGHEVSKSLNGVGCQEDVAPC